MGATLELFRQQDITVPLSQRVAQATKTLIDLMAAGHPLAVAFSGGKDSSVVVNLALTAARSFVQQGGRPVLAVHSGDTRVENPEVAEHLRAEHQRIARFAKRHRIRVHCDIVQPSLLSTFQLKVLTGRGLPSFPGPGKVDCSTDLKVHPQRVHRRRLFRELADQGGIPPITLVGTRLDESERRRLHMQARGDRADQPVLNKDGDLVLTPIAHWSEEDVWEYLGECASALREAYSDFSETMRIYAHSAGTSCAIVADALMEGGEVQRAGRCGARHGCWSCQMTEDRSLRNMIEFDERYSYARGLYRLNRFIKATRYDWSRRHWVGRTIREGYVSVQPDTYHPARMVRPLLQYMLQLDHDERIRASRAGERPKFELIPLTMLVAIDALQSLNGYGRPFQCWQDWNEIVNLGHRYDIPELQVVPPTPLPDARFLHVGRDWDDQWDDASWMGARDPVREALCSDTPCAPSLAVLDDGRVTWDADTHAQFDVDEEGTEMLLDFELDRLREMAAASYVPGGITAGYKFYRSYGLLNLSHSQIAEHDRVCRRTEFKDRKGLTVDYDPKRIYAEAVAYGELPVQARRAWAHKARDTTSQVGLFADASASDFAVGAAV